MSRSWPGLGENSRTCRRDSGAGSLEESRGGHGLWDEAKEEVSKATVRITVLHLRIMKSHLGFGVAVTQLDLPLERSLYLEGGVERKWVDPSGGPSENAGLHEK